MISLHLIRPTALFSADQGRCSTLCERQIVGCMSSMGALELSTRSECLPAILTDGLQHVETWLPCFLFPLHKQAVIDQRGDYIQNGSDILARCCAYRLGRFERTASHKNTQGAEEALLLSREQVVTPGDSGAQRVLVDRRISSAAGEHLEALRETCQQCPWWENLETCGGQHKRQGQAVQEHADLGDGSRIVPGQLEIGLVGLRLLSEECH